MLGKPVAAGIVPQMTGHIPKLIYVNPQQAAEISFEYLD
jgi:hypothetical protein